MLAVHGLIVLISQELTGEFIVTINHSIELTESYVSQDTDWETDVNIVQEFTTNLKAITLEDVITLSQSVVSANKFLNIIEPIFMDESLTLSVDDLLDDQTTDIFTIDHVLSVGHEANKALTLDLTVKSEFFVFTVTQGEDYGSP